MNKIFKLALTFFTLALFLLILTSSSILAHDGVAIDPFDGSCPPSHHPNSAGTACDHDSGGGGAGTIGTINPGNNFVPTASGDPSVLAARIVKSIVTLLLIVAFIIALIWNILAGLKFITSNGDPKGISEAWSRIYWGLIGLVVVVGSFAIIKMVELFFNIDIITGGLKLPTIQ